MSIYGHRCPDCGYSVEYHCSVCGKCDDCHDDEECKGIQIW